MWAILVDRGLRPWEIVRLTLRQIMDLYFHPRDLKTGQILIPTVADRIEPQRDEPLTLADELMTLKQLQEAMAAMGIPIQEEQVEKAKADLKAKMNNGSSVVNSD